MEIIHAILSVGSLLGGFVAFLFYSLQLFESRTVQLYLSTRRLRKIAGLKKRLASLEAREIALERMRADIEHSES